MAKFGSYYNLCPLTDIKGLQGVSRDKEDGQVIVTYRRNLAIKYRLQDQRQVHSWRTKESFSSPVVWCESLQKYFAAFGERYVRCWNGDEEYLDKLKKHKFNDNIKTLISVSHGRQCFVVFTNGTVLPLELVMSQDTNDASNLTALKPDNLTGDVQQVMDCVVGDKIYIGMTLSTVDMSFKFAWTSFDKDGEGLDSGSFELDRSAAEDVTVAGSVISAIDREPYLMLLWSDGRLFQVHLHTVDTSSIDVYGSGFQAFTNSLAMISLGDTQQHIAIFGEASAGEGALLALYGIRTRHVGPTLALKVRGDSKDGGLWHCGVDRILVHVGQNLVVMPVLLAEEELAHLLGADENMLDAVEHAQVVTHLDVASARRVVDLDEDVVVHLIVQALPDMENVLKIITKSAVNDQRLIRALRKHLAFTDALHLFQHLISSLSDDETTTEPDKRSSSSAIVQYVMWATCLLDANYQQLSIASCDPDIADALLRCCQTINVHKTFLRMLRELLPMVERVVKVGKGRKSKGNEENRALVDYSVESFELY